MLLNQERTAIVIGSGVIGLACAIELQSRGIDTLLVAPDSGRNEASWGNAGHIATEQTVPLASLRTLKAMPRRLFSRGGAVALPPRDCATWIPFASRLLLSAGRSRFDRGSAALRAALSEALPSWRRLVQRLASPDLLLEDGHYVVWETETSAARGIETWAKVDTGTAHFRIADAGELAILARLMTSPPAGAIRFFGSGQIADLAQLADALEACFAQLGGTRRSDRVAALNLNGGEVGVRIESGESLDAAAVVVAAGAASGELLRPLGHSVPIIAERGYHVEASETEWPSDLPPVVFEDRSMIVTRFRSGLRAASFVEFARRDSPPDTRKWARLQKHIAALGLSFRGEQREWMGARPTLPDYLPAIGRSSRARNLFYAFGHQHLGLTLAAATGETVAALVSGEKPLLDTAPFALERFG